MREDLAKAFFWLLVPQDTVDALWVVAAWSESMFFSAAFALQVRTSVFVDLLPICQKH